MIPLTPERLRELLQYDLETGSFIWRVTRSRGARALNVAGQSTANGYRSIKIDGRKHLAHRLAWLYVHGKWPQQDIDHINGVRDDNRIVNLRDVSRSVNLQNQRRARSLTSGGLIGASKRKPQNDWQASIKVDGKKRYLGLFNTPEAAHAAYVAAKRKYHEGCTL